MREICPSDVNPSGVSRLQTAVPMASICGGVVPDWTMAIRTVGGAFGAACGSTDRPQPTSSSAATMTEGNAPLGQINLSSLSLPIIDRLTLIVKQSDEDA
jgi:hypothetical protein